MNQNILAGLRTANQGSNISRVTIQDIAAAISIVNFRMTKSNAGQEFLHLVAADGRYLSVKLGKKVQLVATEISARITELLKNYVIYTGRGDSRKPAGPDNQAIWFTFSTVGELKDTPMVSAASILAAFSNASQQLEGATA